MRVLVPALVLSLLACARSEQTPTITRDPAKPVEAGKPPEKIGFFRGLEWDMSPAVAQQTLEANGITVRYEVTRGYFLSTAAPGTKPRGPEHTSEPMLMLANLEGGFTGTVVFDNEHHMVRLELRSPSMNDEKAAREVALPPTDSRTRVLARAEADGAGKFRRAATYLPPLDAGA